MEGGPVRGHGPFGGGTVEGGSVRGDGPVGGGTVEGGSVRGGGTVGEGIVEGGPVRGYGPVGGGPVEGGPVREGGPVGGGTVEGGSVRCYPRFVHVPHILWFKMVFVQNLAQVVEELVHICTIKASCPRKARGLGTPYRESGVPL